MIPSPGILVPKRKLEDHFPFDEGDLRDQRSIFGDRNQTIHVLKVIRKRDFPGDDTISLLAKFLDQAFCCLFAELGDLNKQRKYWRKHVTLLFAASLSSCLISPVEPMLDRKVGGKLGESLLLPEETLPLWQVFQVCTQMN